MLLIIHTIENMYPPLVLLAFNINDNFCRCCGRVMFPLFLLAFLHILVDLAMSYSINKLVTR